MNKKRKIILGIILVILSFAVFLTIRYYQKYVIHTNINRLKSDNVSVRDQAVKNLVEVGEPAVEPLLFALNYDPSYVKNGTMGIVASVIKHKKVKKIAENISIETHNLKMGAIETLGLIGDPRAVDPLVNILLEEESYRENASQALGRIGAPSVTPLVIHKNFPDEKVKIAIIGTLGKTHSGEAVPALIDFLRERDEKFSNAAAIALEDVGKPAIAPLGKVLLNDKDSLLLIFRIIRILGSIKDPDSVRLLLKVTDDDKYEFWRAASETLEKINYLEAIPALIDGLKSPDKHIIYESNSLLSKFNDKSIPGELIKLLTYNNKYTRSCSVYLLQKYKAPESVEPLIERLRDSDQDVRIAAAQVLGYIGDRRAVIPLAEAMGKTDENTCMAIHISLSELNDKSCVETLLNNLKNNNLNHEAEWRTVILLGELKDKRATEALLLKLNSNDEHIKNRAIDALGEIGDKRAVEPLLEILRKTDDDILKGEVAEALGKIGDKRAVGPLIQSFRYSDNYDSKSTITALGQTKDPEAYKFLMKLLKEKRYREKGDVIEALGYFDNPEVLKIIRNAMKDKDYFIQSGAIRGLCNMNSPHIIPYLVEALKDGGSYVQYHVLNKLSKIDNPAVVDNLIKSVESSDLRGKWLAVEILGNRKDPRAVAPLVSALKTDDEALRYRIIIALVKIGEPSRKYLLSFKLKGKGNKLFEAGRKKALEAFDDPEFMKKVERQNEILKSQENRGPGL